MSNQSELIARLESVQLERTSASRTVCQIGLRIQQRRTREQRQQLWNWLRNIQPECSLVQRSRPNSFECLSGVGLGLRILQVFDVPDGVIGSERTAGVKDNTVTQF